VNRPVGYVSLVLALLAGIAGALVEGTPLLDEFPFTMLAAKALYALGVVLGANGCYLLVSRYLVARSANKRRAHDARNVLRLAFGVVTLVAVLGILTNQWVGVLVSFGVIGFAITFALQQPLLSLLGWVYIMTKRPYEVGDRVEIEGRKGDVVEVDFLVTELWEIDGELVASNQPSGRVVTVPNSVVLSSEVVNYTAGFDAIWNEVVVQVAYETDLAFARERMVAVAEDYLGDEMSRGVAEYTDALARTPVELDVQDHPSVNVRQQESWVELRLRYTVNPRRGARVRNELSKRVLVDLNEHPERVKFPVGRNR
jgi:small-conductance mechanosensitive channel